MKGSEPTGTRDAAAATTGASVVSGGLWSIAGRLVPHLYTLLISVAAARYLGPEGLGRQSFIAFVELSIILLFTAGLPMAVMRFIGETIGRGEPGAVRGLVAWAWLIEGVGAAAGGAMLVGAALLGADPEGAWLLAAVACAIGIVHNVPSALLAGAQRWRAASIVGLLTGAVSMVATIAVLAAGGGITGMFAVEAAVSVVNLAWTSVLARRALLEIAPRAEPSAELRRRTARYALYASMSVVITFIVWRRSELFFLDRYSTDTQIALYSIPFAAFFALAQIPSALGAVISPAVATLFGAGASERIRSGYERALRLVLLFSLPITAAALALGPAALRLVYGQDFEGTGRVFLIMALWFPVFPLVTMGRSVLAGLGLVKLPLLFGAVAAAVDITLAVLLTPDHGAVGAALANLAAQVTVGVPILIYASRVVGSTGWRPLSLWRVALVSAIAGGAAWLCVHLLEGAGGFALGAASGAILLGVLTLGLRVIPADDADWIGAVAGGRLGGMVGWAARRSAYRR